MASSADKNTQPKKATELANLPEQKVYSYTVADRDCLKRAMYFESKRTSKNGFMAVGTVVMNRLTSGAYPDTICGVVGQKKQFAPGVMTRAMREDTTPDIDGAVDAIIRGERHPQVKEAMFFHTDGLKFPYNNMHYVTVAGGNAFYEKRGQDGELQTPEPQPVENYMLAFAGAKRMPAGLKIDAPKSDQAASSIMLASSEIIPALPTDIPLPAPRPVIVSALTPAAPEMASMTQTSTMRDDFDLSKPSDGFATSTIGKSSRTQ